MKKVNYCCHLYKVLKSVGAESDFGHFLPVVVFVWQDVTSQWCSIVTSGLDGTVVKLYAVKFNRRRIKKKNVGWYLQSCMDSTVQLIKQLW